MSYKFTVKEFWWFCLQNLFMVVARSPEKIKGILVNNDCRILFSNESNYLWNKNGFSKLWNFMKPWHVLDSEHISGYKSKVNDILSLPLEDIFDVYMSLPMKITLFWDTAPCTVGRSNENRVPTRDKINGHSLIFDEVIIKYCLKFFSRDCP